MTVTINGTSGVTAPNVLALQSVQTANFTAAVGNFPSWILNQTTWLWDAPTLYPTDGKLYQWDEPTKSWVLVQQGE